jgi:hypothetical protein
MKKLLVLVLLTINTSIFAQVEFRPGYVILNSGDTLTGEIDFRDDKIMTKTCRFRENKKSEFREFSPIEIQGYRLTNGKYYISQELPEGGRVFLEYLVNGKLSLYYDRDEKGDHFYIKKEGDIIRLLPEEESIIIVKNRQYYRPPLALIALLNYLTQDAPELQKEIMDIESVDQRNMVKLAVNYQNIVCPDESCTLYKKNVPRSRVTVQPVIGLTYYSSIDHLFEYGAFVNFWTPLSNERLYFKTGLTISSIPVNSGILEDYKYSGTLYRVPIQIRYLSPGKYIRPEFSVGPNVYFFKKSIGNTFDLSGGINIKLHKELYLYTGANLETIPLLAVLLSDTHFGLVSFSAFAGFNFIF